MNNKLSIYLAGAMSGKSFEEMNAWRVEIKNILTHMGSYHDCNIRVTNPVEYYNFIEKRHKTEKEVMQFDLSRVKSSDIVVVNLDGINTSIGTSMELYECYRSNILEQMKNMRMLIHGLRNVLRDMKIPLKMQLHILKISI